MSAEETSAPGKEEDCHILQIKTNAKNQVSPSSKSHKLENVKFMASEQPTKSLNPKPMIGLSKKHFDLQAFTIPNKAYVDRPTEQLRSITSTISTILTITPTTTTQTLSDFSSITKPKITSLKDIGSSIGSNQYLKKQQQQQHQQQQPAQPQPRPPRHQQSQLNQQQPLLGHLPNSPYKCLQRYKQYQHPITSTKPYDRPCKTFNSNQLQLNRRTLLPTPRKTLLEPLNKIKPLMPELENSSFTDSNIMLIKAIKLGIKQKTSHL